MINMAKDMKVTCKDCNKQFTISEDELKWLADKGFKPFKRCKEFRKKRKQKEN